METLFKWITAVGGVFHWLTGWLIHPDKGGCCHTDQVKEKVENLKNNNN